MNLYVLYAYRGSFDDYIDRVVFVTLDEDKANKAFSSAKEAEEKNGRENTLNYKDPIEFTLEVVIMDSWLNFEPGQLTL